MKTQVVSRWPKFKRPIFHSSYASLLFVALLTSGCAGLKFGAAHHTASSVVDYLYPKKTEHVDVPTIPVLSLPLKVGVAFVPRQSEGGLRVLDETLSEARKVKLLQQVSTNFLQYPFVHSIEIIPSAYLRPGGGFVNVDQPRSMFGIDVIALVGYDQVQFTDQGLLSMSYWTVVGAYLVRGEKNDSETMIDAVVYDIPSRKLLFRAPGTSSISGAGTLVNQSEQLRKDRDEGFQRAATNMVANLDHQLALFLERVKQAPEEYKIVRKSGYTGGGTVGLLELLLLCGTIAFLWRRSPRESGQ